MPRFFKVRMPRVETSIFTVLPSSGKKIFFFCKLGYFLTLPVGLNLVARVRLEYPPPTNDFLFDITHVFIPLENLNNKIYFFHKSADFLTGQVACACYHIRNMNAIFYIAILIMSVVIHEVSHCFAAERFGDKTARYAGRLTLNPLSHLDIFGSLILPAVLYFSTGFVFGWAKPVPYNPDNLSNKRWGTVAVASAGVLSNLLL